jgi:hypothetical protein
MPRTIHVTVTYSVHIDDTDSRIKSGKVSAKDAIEWAEEHFEQEGNVIDIKSTVFEAWEDPAQVIRKGKGSY